MVSVDRPQALAFAAHPEVMERYDWARWPRRRCPRRHEKPTWGALYHGRCELKRGHGGPHALARRGDIVIFYKGTTRYTKGRK